MGNDDIKYYGAKTRFKPGVSGNPAGRPKGSRNKRTIVKEMLEGRDFDWSMLPVSNPHQLETMYDSVAQALVYRAFAEALSGNVRAMYWLSDNLYGKVRQ